MARDSIRATAIRLEKAMQIAKVTQSELAEAVGATQSAVSQWLAGKKMPSRDKLRSAAAHLNVALDWLEGEGEAPIPVGIKAATPTLSPVHWWFRREPPDRARDYGNSNVWAFRPDIPTLVREALQNIIDASRDQQVDAVFRIIRLTGSDLDDFLKTLRWRDELLPHLQASVKNEQKLGKLLRYGLNKLEETRELLLLLIEDNGTIGLVGEEFGTGNFVALCRNNLDSEKQTGTAGGAFGLGKAAFWLTSLFSVVLFHSDLSKPNEHGKQYGRMIGRADLAWHQVTDKGYAGPGWFGQLEQVSPNEQTAVSSWGDKALAEALHMTRQSGRTGSSILVVGFHDPSADEPKDVRQLAIDIEAAVADNFWPVLASGRLTVKIETAEGRNVKTASPVDPTVHRPEFVAARSKHPDDVVDKLSQEGHVVGRAVPLRIPRRRAASDPHGELVHEAVLLVRRASEHSSTGRSNQVAFYRGRGMVIRYLDLKQLYVGSVPFHAVVMAGSAVGNSPADQAAEVFLRTAEPPAHSEWTSTSDLKTDYVPGSKRSLDRFLDDIKTQIRDIVRIDTVEASDGPQALKELLRLETSTPPRPDPIRITRVNGQPDAQGRWVVEATIRVRLDDEDKRGWRVQPVLIFNAETGGGQVVPWESLDGLKDCESNGGWLTIPEGKREVRFRGVSDLKHHPVPTQYSSVTVDLRRPGRLDGGAA